LLDAPARNAGRLWHQHRANLSLREMPVGSWVDSGALSR